MVCKAAEKKKKNTPTQSRRTRQKTDPKDKEKKEQTNNGNGQDLKQYTVFITQSGQEKTFTNAQDAADYEKEMEDSIVDTLTFDTEKAYKEHIKRSAQATNGRKNTTLTKEEQKARERVRLTREQNAPKRQIHLQWKTNAYTTACLVTIDFFDTQARPMWFVKAKDTTQTLTAMYLDGVLDPLSDKVGELISNLSYIERVSPLNNEEVDKNGSYPNYKIYSYFLLPEESQSMQNEHAYIEDTLKSFGAELRNIMNTNMYQLCLRDTVDSYSTKLSAAMFEPKKGLSFSLYIQNISVTVQQMTHYTDHVPKSSVTTLQGIIQQHEINKRKYPTHLRADNDPPTEQNTSDDNSTIPTS